MAVIDYIKVLRHGWRWLMIATLLGLGLGFAAVASTPREYTATTQLFVSARGGSTAADLLQGSNFSQQRVKSYADVVRSNSVLIPVAQRLNVPGGAAQLKQDTSVTVPLDTVLIAVSVRSRSRARSAVLANAVASQFGTVVASLELPLGGNSSDAAAPSVRVSTVERAQPPAVPSSPKVKLYLILGGLFGLAVGWLTVLARALLVTRVRSPQEVAEISDVPLLGTIPRRKDAAREPIVFKSEPAGGAAEAFRHVRTNLRYLNVDRPIRKVAVTSALGAEGKSSVSANLAASLCETGARTVLVDADLRRPSAARYLGVPSHPGLTAVLTGAATLDDALQQWGDTALFILPAGEIPPNPSELLGTDALGQLIEELGRRFDYVIIDTPPVLPVTDAVVLSTKVDAVLVVARHNVVKRGELASALDRLGQVDATVAGVVYNALPGGRGGGYEYYGSRYSPTEPLTTNGSRPQDAESGVMSAPDVAARPLADVANGGAQSTPASHR